jgi:hypothetical protein
MTSTRHTQIPSGLQRLPPFAGHAPRRERPLGSYALLTATYVGGCAGFAAWWRRAGRPLPERPAPADLLLISIATHKLARLIAKDRVFSALRAPFTRFQHDAGPGEVEEAARGQGLQRAIGELVVCPYCLSVWLATAFTAGLIAAPRPTRWAAAALNVVTASDMLQIAYKNAEETLGS